MPGRKSRDMDGRNYTTHEDLYSAWRLTLAVSTSQYYGRSIRAYMAFLDRLDLDILEHGEDHSYQEAFVYSRPSDSVVTQMRHGIAIRSFFKFVKSIQ